MYLFDSGFSNKQMILNHKFDVTSKYHRLGAECHFGSNANWK